MLTLEDPCREGSSYDSHLQGQVGHVLKGDEAAKEGQEGGREKGQWLLLKALGCSTAAWTPTARTTRQN